jgi:hypothetical protein
MNLILFCMQEHYRLANRVSEAEASLIFYNAACKVIKDTIKHTHCIYVASYYMQVNLLLFCTQVLKFLFFTLTCRCNSLLHACVEAGDEAHPGPCELSEQGAAPSGYGRLVGEGSGGLGLALRLVGVRLV